MSYPYRPPGPYRSGITVEPTKIEVHDAFWVGFKVACGVVCGLTVCFLVAGICWGLVLLSLIALGQS